VFLLLCISIRRGSMSQVLLGGVPHVSSVARAPRFAFRRAGARDYVCLQGHGVRRFYAGIGEMRVQWRVAIVTASDLLFPLCREQLRIGKGALFEGADEAKPSHRKGPSDGLVRGWLGCVSGVTAQVVEVSYGRKQPVALCTRWFQIRRDATREGPSDVLVSGSDERLDGRPDHH